MDLFTYPFPNTDAGCGNLCVKEAPGLTLHIKSWHNVAGIIDQTLKLITYIPYLKLMSKLWDV